MRRRALSLFSAYGQKVDIGVGWYGCYMSEKCHEDLDCVMGWTKWYPEPHHGDKSLHEMADVEAGVIPLGFGGHVGNAHGCLD